MKTTLKIHENNKRVASTEIDYSIHSTDEQLQKLKEDITYLLTVPSVTKLVIEKVS